MSFFHLTKSPDWNMSTSLPPGSCEKGDVSKVYTILITENNELLTTVRERIMQRSKLVDNLRFLADQTYNGYNMADFTLSMEYLLPASREYKHEFLTLSDERYSDKLQYVLPIDTCLTKEPGEIEIQLTFSRVSLDADGNSKQQVRKISPTTITIVPISAWSDIIADSALSALDQRIIQVDAMLNAMNDMNQYMYENKADNIMFNSKDSTIQLTANGEPIGDTIVVSADGACGIVSVEVNDEGHLITTLSDGRVIDAGYVGNTGGVVFVPSISDDYILSWTNNGGLDNPEPVDLYPHDEWNTTPEEGVVSEYTWEFI